MPVENEGDVSPLLEYANSLDQPASKTKEIAEKPSERPFDPENPPLADNGNASFERFMGSFGAPARWSGR